MHFCLARAESLIVMSLRLLTCEKRCRFKTHIVVFCLARAYPVAQIFGKSECARSSEKYSEYAPLRLTQLKTLSLRAFVGEFAV